MNKPLIFMAVMVAIILVAVILFRKKIIEWDTHMAAKLKQFTASQKQATKKENSEQEFYAMPTAIYNTRRLGPDGDLSIMEESFTCTGTTLDSAINGIIYLRELASGRLDKEDKKGKKKIQNNYIGVG